MRRIVSIGDCVALVRHVVVARGSTERAVDVLVRSLVLQPPTELEMRRLSLLQQQVAGTHGEAEYAATTLWLCAIQSIAEGRRCRSRRRTAPVCRLRRRRQRRRRTV